MKYRRYFISTKWFNEKTAPVPALTPGIQPAFFNKAFPIWIRNSFCCALSLRSLCGFAPFSRSYLL